MIKPYRLCVWTLVWGTLIIDPARASTGVERILQMGAYRSPAVVFVLLDSSPTLASCANNAAWAYVFPMSTDQDKKLFAMLLEAQVAGKIVSIQGTGPCADFNGIESAAYINISN